MRRNMVQAEAQNQEEAFDLDILDSPSGSKLADQILPPVGKSYGKMTILNQYSLQEKALNVRTGQSVL